MDIDSKKTFKRLSSYFFRYKKEFFISLCAMAVSATTEPLFASLMKPLVDVNFSSEAYKDITFVPLAIVGLVIVRSISNYIAEYSSTWLAGKLVQDLRTEMFGKLIRLPNSFFDHNPTGTIVSKFLYEVSLVTEAGINVITTIIKDCLTVVCLIGLLFYYNWQLTSIFFIAIPFINKTIKFSRNRLRNLSVDAQIAVRQFTNIISETSQNQRVVKIYGGEKFEKSKFDERINYSRQLLVKQNAANALSSGIVQVIISIVLALIIYYASSQSDNNLSAGDFVSYMTAMMMLFSPVKRVTSINNTLQRGLVAADSVFKFIDLPEESSTPTASIGNKPRGEIRFENVNFYYQDSTRPALKNLSLSFPAGKTVALVGSSGSGKSTLAALIPRFYECSEGNIYIDNINIRDIALQELRNHIAVVTQEVNLFDCSVRENIAYGDLSVHQLDSVIEAAKAANAYQFIKQLPDLFDTQIGEKGSRLSGGQKQRIAIARAILKNAPILILDEATSALDNESERLVQQAIDVIAKERTTIVIAHRLSTIENADLIVVMDNGSIVEQGTHHELISRQSFYYNLYKQLQQNSPEA